METDPFAIIPHSQNDGDIRWAVVREAVHAERERCAKIAIAKAERHRDRCSPDCKCADGWHIAFAIRDTGA